jgi:thiamine-monophosphate kinase
MGDSSGGVAEVPFMPVGRLHEGQRIAGIASACMDTSDGVIAALDELMLLNGVGVSWERPLLEVLHPAALATARHAGFPPWTMLAGPHGEFELLFTVPPERCGELHDAAAEIGWTPLELGRMTAEPGCRIRDGAEWLVFDTCRIRNLFGEVGGDPARYSRELLGSALKPPQPGRSPRLERTASARTDMR